MAKSYATTWQKPGSSRVAETLKFSSSIFDKYNWTIGFWFKPTNTQTISSRYVCLFDIYINSNNYWRMVIDPLGIPYFEIKSGGTAYSSYNASDTVTVKDNWYYLAAYGNMESFEFTINGFVTTAGTIDYVLPVGDIPTYLFLGSNYGGDSQPNGIYSDLIVLPYRSNQSQIWGFYASNRPYYNLPRFEVTGDLVNKTIINPLICDGEIKNIDVTDASMRQYYKISFNIKDVPGLISVLTTTQEEEIALTPNPVYYVSGYCYGSPSHTGVDATKLDVLYFAFAIPQDLVLTFSAPSYESYLPLFTALKAQNPNLKVVLAVGGGGLDRSVTFSPVLSSAANRATFIASCQYYVDKYALDGIDIDYEWPLSSERTSYTLLMQGLRNSLGSSAYLSSTVLAGFGSSYWDYLSISYVVDTINLMTYDFHLSSTFYHESNLYISTLGPTYSCKTTVDYVTGFGVPAKKLNLGVPFYGRLDGGGTTYSYTTLAASYINLNGYIRNWDTTAKAPYLSLNGVNRISYDDAAGFAEKATYLKAAGLYGMFSWQLRQDSTNTLLNAMYNNLK